MGLRTRNEVVMEADALTRNESMRGGVYPVTQNGPEESGHACFHCHQELR